MDAKQLQWIRVVAADCPYPPSGKTVDYDLGLAARHGLPAVLAEYDAAVRRAEAAEAALAAVPVDALLRTLFTGYRSDAQYTADADAINEWVAKQNKVQP